MVTGNAAREQTRYQAGAPYYPEDADAGQPDVGGIREIDDFADALAAELDMEIAAMNPVDLSTGRVERPSVGSARNPQQAAYDPWDDEALDQFLDDYDLEGVDPLAIAQLEQQSEAAAEEPSGGRWRMAIAGAVALLFLAGAGVGAWSYLAPKVGLSGPVLVKAPEGPFKVKPDPNAKDIVATSEGEAVFDSVGGAKPPVKGEERLVTRSAEVPDLPAVTPQVSRVTLPDGQQVEAELPSGFDPADSGPRRVRTVLVRPDGSLIDNPVGTAGASTAQTPPQDGPGQLIAQAEEGDANDAGSGLPPLSASNQILGNDAIKPPIVAVGKPAPAAPASPTVVEVPADTLPSAPAAPLPPSRPSAAPSVTVASAAPAAAPAAPATAAPLDLAAAARTPAAPAAAATTTTASVSAPVATPSVSAGGYVQLSSQRSEEAALSAFRALQKKFPAILGSLAPDVQKADLGTKGVYYCVRVGQPSRDAAAALCEQLRGAGGDCLLAR